MLDQEKVFKTLASHGVTFFTGVPDSYLNGFCNYALAHCEKNGFLNSHKPDSQDICFVPHGDYAAVIEAFSGRKSPKSSMD